MGRTTPKRKRTRTVSTRKKSNRGVRRAQPARVATRRAVLLQPRALDPGTQLAAAAAADPQPLDEILTRIIAVETGPTGDGFVNRVADRGGATMRGVTL